MQYTFKVGILQLSIASAATAIALGTTTEAWAANLSFVNSRAAIGETDFVDWSSPQTSVPVPSGTRFNISSNGGVVVTADLAGAPGRVLVQNPTGFVVTASDSNALRPTYANPTSWAGNFAPNDAVFWNAGEGKLNLSFATPVASVGTQLNSAFYRDSVAAANGGSPATSPFRGTITAFYGSGQSATFSANGITNGLADNSAAFFGVSSDSADITRIEFDTFNIPTNASYFNYAINRLSFSTTPQAVPEPFTIVGTLIGSAAAFKMRKRFKATNKL